MDTTSKITSTSPLVSILMLTYNRANFIREAVESVVNQTYKNWELIIIDDGSNDDTSKIIADLQDERIKYIHHKNNLGLITRRIESLKYIKGCYTAILDSDDIWISPNKIAEQVEYMEKNPNCCLIGTFIKIIDETTTDIGGNYFEKEDADIRKQMLIRNQFAHSSVLIRTSVLTTTSGYRDTILAEDYELFLQLGLSGTFANLPKYYTAYRIHNESFNHKRLMMAQAVLRIVQSYKEQYPNYYLAKIKCYLRIIFYWSHQNLKQIFIK